MRLGPLRENGKLLRQIVLRRPSAASKMANVANRL
jgi:hypothetical protein